MGENDVCIGVDGGGTKTTAVVIASAGGDVLGQGGSGSTNKNSVGEAVATSSFKSAIADALKAAGRTVEDVVCLAVGMSGCDTDADVVLWRGICESVAPNARAIVENDAVMALCSGTGGVLEGVVVISGTGSIAFGAAPGRPRVRVGGWGAKLGDAGNGCSIGQAALNAVTFASDGRGPPTPLTRLVLDFCKVATEEELLGLSYGDGSGAPARFSSWDEVAALAPLVVAAQQGGCKVAEGILEEAVGAICLLAETAAGRLDGRPGAHDPALGTTGPASVVSSEAITVVLSGGVLSQEDSFISRGVVARLSKTLPKAKLTRPLMVPAEAAARLAACELASK